MRPPEATARGWLARLLGGLRGTPPPPNADETCERLVGLEPHETPFGVRVRDCRPIAETVISRLDYYVVLPQRKRRGPLIQQFVDWLMAEQAGSAQSLNGLPLPSIAV